MLYCSTCGYPAPCGRCEDSDNPSARIRGYGADIEEYRVRINSERTATFDSIEEAAAYFSAYACEHCYRCTRNDHDEADCCGIETWLVE